MSTLLFFASSAAPKGGSHAQVAAPGDPPSLPSVHSPSIWRSDGVVAESACLNSPRFLERSEGWL